MAQVRLNTFTGINNKLAPDRLFSVERDSALTALQTATNVDVTNSGGLRRRPGMVLSFAGEWHSLWSEGDIALAISGGILYSITEGVVTAIGTVSDRPMSYAKDMLGVVYMSNDETVYEYSGGVLTPLNNIGTYDRVTNRLDRASDTVFYDAPPPGYIFEFIFGRLWSVSNHGIAYSIPFYPKRFDLRGTDQIPWPNVTMAKAVADGVFIGTKDSVWFFDGSDVKTMRPRKVSDVGAVLYTPLIIHADRFGVDSASGQAVIWESSKGKVLGLSGGRINYLTDKNISYDVGIVGASYLREVEGMMHHVSSLRSPDYTSSAHTSDIVEVEVIRNGMSI